MVKSKRVKKSKRLIAAEKSYESARKKAAKAQITMTKANKEYKHLDNLYEKAGKRLDKASKR